MIHDFKILIRGIRRDKILSVLIIAGLSLAFCVAIPLICNIKYHLSYDRFHPESDDIFNIYINETYHSTNDVYGELPLAFGEHFKNLFPEVENMVRTKDGSDVLISVDNTMGWKENVLWTDPSFVDVFYLKLLIGNRNSFLEYPNEIYISESLSLKIFGDINSTGKNVKIDGKNYSVRGIFKDYPHNSHMKFSILIPLVSRIPKEDKYEWDSYEFLTYIKLKKNTDIGVFENKLQQFLKEYWIPWLKTNHNLDYVFNNENSLRLKLMPVSDIHLHAGFISSFEKETNSSVVGLNLIIIFVLLFIAYFNLLGFSFSKGKRHQYQIMIKRCLGASGNKLVSAFISEYLIYTFISFFLALIITYEIWSGNPPVLADLSSIPLSGFILPVTSLFVLAVIISVISGTVSGTFFNRLGLKTNSARSFAYSRFWLNRIIIISQMAASIVLIICITGIFKQLNYLASYNTGLDTKNIVIVNNGNRIGDHFTSLKTELKKSPLVEDVSHSNSYPFNWMSTNSYTRANSQDQTPYPFQYFRVDTSFQKVFGFKQIKGRWFSGTSFDNSNAIIFNEAAIKVMNLTHPLDEEFYETIAPIKKYHVIGIVNDFNFQSLHHSVAPLLLTPLRNGDWWRYIEIKGTTSDRARLIDEIKKVWNRVSGNEFLDYSFFEDNIAWLYKKEADIKQAISLFCLIAILISCFGLLGIVLNTATEKTKEIGIRKINGASVTDIIYLLTRDFIKWITIAFIIGCPIAWYSMNKWLQNFAYSTDLSWWIFSLAGIIALSIAMLTVSWQSWRAATRNPVEALRYE
jgi:putative ABC transport system permease protein